MWAKTGRRVSEIIEGVKSLILWQKWMVSNVRSQFRVNVTDSSNFCWLEKIVDGNFVNLKRFDINVSSALSAGFNSGNFIKTYQNTCRHPASVAEAKKGSASIPTQEACKG